MSKPQLTAPVLIALAGGLTDGLKKSLPVGEYEVDCLVRVKATITKAQDTEKKGTANVPLMAALAIFLSKMPKARQSEALESLEAACVLATLQAGNTASNIVEDLGLEGMLERVKATMDNVPRVHVSGATKVKDLSLEIIDETELSA